MKVLLAIVIIVFTSTMHSQTVPVIKERPFEKVQIGENGMPLSDEDLPEAVPAQPIRTQDDNTIHNSAMIQVKPEFPGGVENFRKYVANHFKMPDGDALKGSMWVSFIVEKNGSLTDIKVVRDLGPASVTEMVRVFKRSPNWLPGEHNGYKVRTQDLIRINLPSTE